MVAGEASPVFVGREGEAERLSALARQAAAGHGAAMVIEGEPGIGKTTLLDAVAQDCARLGMRVLRGRAEDLEQQLPFSLIAASLDVLSGAREPSARRVAGLLRGEDAPAGDAVARNYDFVVTEAILDLLDEWCAAGPVALIVDDVQWADPSSLLVLHRVGRGIEEQPLLLVIAARSMVRTDTVTGLIRSLESRGAQRLQLDALAPSAVAQLVGNLLGAQAGPRLLELVARAGGHPMYVTELVAALSREGAIVTADGMAELAGPVADHGAGALPRSLVGTIALRLDFLSRRTRETLQLIAVLCKSIDVTALSEVLDLPVVVLSEVMSEAIESGLIVDTGRDLEFRHDLIRDALADQVPAPIRAALHQRIGQLMTSSGASVEQIAEHLLIGDEPTLDSLAVHWLLEHSDALIVRAPKLAVSLLRRALPGAANGMMTVLRRQLAVALLRDGDAVEAERAARAALSADPDPEQDVALRWLLLQSCYRQGRYADAVAVAQDALSSAPVTEVQAARFASAIPVCLFFNGEVPAAEAAARRAVTTAKASGDRYATGLAYNALAAARFMQEDVDQALELNAEALTAFGQQTMPDQQPGPYALRGYCLLQLDRLREADEALASAVEQNRQTGGAYLMLIYALRAQLRFLDGRWDDALAEIQTGLDLPDPLGDTTRLQGLAALIAVHRGGVLPYAADDPGTAQAVVDGDPVGAGGGQYLVWAAALAQETQAGPQHVLDLLYPLWERTEGRPLLPRRLRYYLCADLARLAAAVGDQRRADDLAAGIEELAGHQPTHSLTGTAQLCRGLAKTDAELLLQAATSFHQAGWPLYEGHAREHAAELLARGGRAKEARAELQAALDLYAGLDATWDVARASARLRQAGVRLGVQGPRKRPKYGWDALTDTEQKVALLVAEGRSNPDVAAQMFLSRRTVQSHVSSIMKKLGLTSRVELALSAANRSRTTETADAK